MKLETRGLIKKTFWTILVSGLGVLCLSAVNFKKHTTIQAIDVEMSGSAEDVYFMKAEDIEREILKLIGPLEKHTVGDISCDIIENELSKNPFIASVDVFVSGNAKLTARIHQREPLLRVIGDGKSFYMDEDGTLMPVSRNYTPRVHVLTGSMANAHSGDILPLALALRENEFMNAFIEQIHYTSKDEIVLVPRVGHALILFGNTERIEDKFEQIQAFYTEVVADAAWDKYSTIDLRFRDQIICKKNPTS